MLKQFELKRRTAEEFISYSLGLHFLEYHYFHRFGIGNVTILLGTSTAGKTTIIEQMKRDTEIIDCSLDLLFHVGVSNIIKNIIPDQHRKLSLFVDHEEISKIFLYEDKIKFKMNVKEKEMFLAEKIVEEMLKIKPKIKNNFSISAFDKIYDDIFEKIINYSIQGKPVVFDIVDIDQLKHFFSKNFRSPTRIMLVFCPLNKLSERIKERNFNSIKNSEFSNQRPLFPLFQFSNLYRKKQNIDEQVFEIIGRLEAEKIFDDHFREEKRNLMLEDVIEPDFNFFKPKEDISGMDKNDEIKIKKTDLKKIFLEKLGFVSPEIQFVEITSRFKFFDDFIDTNNLNHKLKNRVA